MEISKAPVDIKSDNVILLLRMEKQKSKDPRGGHNVEYK